MLNKYRMNLLPIVWKPQSISVTPQTENLDYENEITCVSNMISVEDAKRLRDFASNADLSGLHHRRSKTESVVASFHTCLVFNQSDPIYELLNDQWHTVDDTVVQIEPYEIKIYNEGDSFGKHHDGVVDIKNTLHRKVILIVQLSDPSEYDGGELRIGPHVLGKNIGDAIFFPSYYYHDVSMLTRGTRYSLIGHGWCPVTNRK